MIEHIRHPVNHTLYREIPKFLDAMQKLQTDLGPKGTDTVEQASEKEAILNQHASGVVWKFENSADLDKVRRKKRAIRLAYWRSPVLGHLVRDALMPPSGEVIQLPVAPPPAPKKAKENIDPEALPPPAKAQLQTVPPYVDEMNLVDAAKKKHVKNRSVRVLEKPWQRGFVADVTVHDFLHRFFTGAAHKRFKAMGRTWRIDLVRNDSADVQAGFWVRLVDGNALNAKLAVWIIRADGHVEGLNTGIPLHWQATDLEHHDEDTWGYTWRNFNEAIFDANGACPWLDEHGDLRCRIEITTI